MEWLSAHTVTETKICSVASCPREISTPGSGLCDDHVAYLNGSRPAPIDSGREIVIWPGATVADNGDGPGPSDDRRASYCREDGCGLVALERPRTPRNGYCEEHGDERVATQQAKRLRTMRERYNTGSAQAAAAAVDPEPAEPKPRRNRGTSTTVPKAPEPSLSELAELIETDDAGIAELERALAAAHDSRRLHIGRLRSLLDERIPAPD